MLGGSVPTIITTQSSATAVIGFMVTLDCEYTSLWNVSAVFWLKLTNTESILLDGTKDPNLYSGGTVQNASLVIKNLHIQDKGNYVCCVRNKFGIGRGSNISVYITPGNSILMVFKMGMFKIYL